MKLQKTASGKQILKISKNEWEKIGEKTGWNAPSSDFAEFMDSLEKNNPAKIGPAVHLKTNKDGNLVPLREFDRKKINELIGKDIFNRHPESVRSIQNKLLDNNYELLIDGKGVNRYIRELIATKDQRQHPIYDDEIHCFCGYNSQTLD